MPYLEKMINNHKANGDWKIQLAMRINFISSLDTNDFRTMHTKSDNVKILEGTETYNIITELFKSFLKKYQAGLETKMEGSNFVFESVDLLYYSLHKISLNRGGSYIDSPDWIKNKKTTMNRKNKDNECFKYAITTALNYSKINNHPEKVSKLKPFIENYNWKDTEFPSCSKIGKNLNKIIIQLLLIFYMYHTILNK